VESKILNFPDAMRLAQIVSKYLDTESIKKMTGEEFAYDLFSLMDTDEIMYIASLFSLENSIDPEELILSCVKNMIENNILDLLVAYKQIGFGK
jgi:hypothetical protein